MAVGDLGHMSSIRCSRASGLILGPVKRVGSMVSNEEK